MRREEKEALAVYRFDSIPGERVDCFVSTRTGGVSKAPYSSLNLGFRVEDDADDVLANRRRLFNTFGLDLEGSVWCRQIHRDEVARVGLADRGRGALDEENIVADADALITDVVGLPICVTLADCVPVLIYDPQHHVVGLAHAGWGGTVRRISGATVRAMGEAWGSRPDQLVAAIGPSISPQDYEVGEDVISQAEAAYGAVSGQILKRRPDGKAQFDLWRANALDLLEAGLSESAIEIAGISTSGNLDQFYSHRFEGPTGRFATVAQLL